VTVIAQVNKPKEGKLGLSTQLVHNVSKLMEICFNLIRQNKKNITSHDSTLEVSNVMCFINQCFTHSLTYLLTADSQYCVE